ncbi:hypothetical protein [Kitasatospora sp. NPDC101183]|uniref:hypothetical protein n=1 Tax=Kitasatospora sp. NPDC101183 TaxID=3364100 RepID=UPI003820C6FF
MIPAAGTGAVAAPDERRLRLAVLLEETSPAARTAARVLPVLEPLAPFLPGAGLTRGTVVETGDTGLLLALAAGPLAADPACWAVAVDLPDLGLAAAAGYGLPLNRLILADNAGEHFAEVLTALLARLPPRAAARVDAHLRPPGGGGHARPYGGHHHLTRLRVGARRREARPHPGCRGRRPRGRPVVE